MNSRRIIQAASICVLLVLVSYTVAVAKNRWEADNPTYPVGSHYVHFGAEVAYGNFSYYSIQEEAWKRAKAHLSDPQKLSFIWDDKYYSVRMQDSGTSYLLCFWHDRNEPLYNRNGTKNERSVGWVAVKNTPQKWRVIKSTDKRHEYIPGNAQQVKTRFTISRAVVDIDIYNPDNSGGVTPNDIYYGFGY